MDNGTILGKYCGLFSTLCLNPIYCGILSQTKCYLVLLVYFSCFIRSSIISAKETCVDVAVESVLERASKWISAEETRSRHVRTSFLAISFQEICLQFLVNLFPSSLFLENSYKLDLFNSKKKTQNLVTDLIFLVASEASFPPKYLTNLVVLLIFPESTPRQHSMTQMGCWGFLLLSFFWTIISELWLV